MSEASIKFNDKSAQKFFKSVIKKSKDIDGRKRVFVFAVVGKNVFEDYEDHFENQQGGPSQLWPEWSDAYLKHLRRKGKQGNNILQDNGRMKRSFKMNNYRISKDGIAFFNNAKTSSGFPYAAAHNEGGPKLPQRKFMWLSAKARRRIGKQTLEFLTGGK